MLRPISLYQRGLRAARWAALGRPEPRARQITGPCFRARLAARFAPLSLAVPVETDLGAWQTALSQELQNAKTQAGDAAGARGFTILLKKNGRVGTRRLGTPDWENLVLDVASRKAAGLDVKNI